MQELRLSPHLPIVAKGMPGQLPPHVSERQLFTLASAVAGADSRGKSNDKRRFLERDRRSLYRHWHLPGGTHPNTYETVGCNEVHIPITRGAHNTSFVDGATFAYLVEQIELRKAYMSMSEINAAISSDLGELLKTPKALDPNFVTDHLVEHSDGSLRLRYPMVTQGGVAVLFEIYLYGNQYVLPRDIAEIIIYEEVAKRKRYITPPDLAKLTGRTREGLVGDARSGKFEASYCDHHCFIYRPAVAHLIEKAESKVTELPKNKRPLRPALEKLDIPISSFEESTVEHRGCTYFKFKYLSEQGLQTKEFRVYQAISGARYLAAEDLNEMLELNKQTGRWLTTDQLSARTHVKAETLHKRPNVAKGTIEIGFGPGLYAEVRYADYRDESRFHPQDSRLLAEVVARIGTRLRRLDTLSARSDRLLVPHLDFPNKTIHLTETFSPGAPFPYHEHKCIGVRFEIFLLPTGEQVVAINTGDAPLIDFYLSLRSGAVGARRKLAELDKRLHTSEPNLTQLELAMLGVTSFLHDHPTNESKALVTSFIRGNPQYAEATIFKEDSPLSRLDERYRVGVRTKASSVLIIPILHAKLM